MQVRIEEVWVDPAYRGQGLGGHMAQALASNLCELLTPYAACEVTCIVQAATVSTSGARFVQACAKSLEALSRRAVMLETLDQSFDLYASSGAPARPRLS